MDSRLNIVKKPYWSLAISDMESYCSNLFARLLCGSFEVESGFGRWHCKAEAFDRAALLKVGCRVGWEMKDVDCSTKFANDKEYRWSGGGE